MTDSALQPTRAGGAAVGFALAGLPGLGLVVLAELNNPAFVDEPWSLWVVSVGLPGLIGAVVGAWIKARLRRSVTSAGLATAAVVLGVSMGDGRRPLVELDLVVLGIDGADWDVIDPLLEGGELPGLARLRSEGATGTLRAHEPLFSPLLWTTLATGFLPEDHGVRGFRVHADDCRLPRFFDVAEAQGHRLGLYKWLVTWPPRRLDHGGFIVPGWLAPSAETAPEELGFVKELELARRLERRRVEARRSSLQLAVAGVRHGLRWSTVRDAGWWWLREAVHPPEPRVRAWKLQLLRVRIDRDVFTFALRHHRPSVATFTVYATDALAHRYWRYHEPTSQVDPDEVARFGGVVAEAYREADQVLVEVLALLPEDGRLLVVSDHGFQAVDGAGIAPRTERLEALLGREVGPVQVGRLGARITVVLEGEDPTAQRAALDQSLEGLVRQGTGAPLFRWAALPGEPRAVVLDLREPSAVDLGGDRVGTEPLSDWVRPVDEVSGEHDPIGVFAAWGPGVEPGSRVELDGLDLAPIALAGLGIPRGADMVGRVPGGLWSEAGTVPSWGHLRHELVFPDAAGAGVNEEMLRALGYLDGPPEH